MAKACEGRFKFSGLVSCIATSAGGWRRACSGTQVGVRLGKPLTVQKSSFMHHLNGPKWVLVTSQVLEPCAGVRTVRAVATLSMAFRDAPF